MASLATPEADLLAAGTVIPAHPLALTPERTLDERHQRALARYYVAAGAGGVAVGVHTTQFEIRKPEIGLFAPVLELAAETVDAALAAESERASGVVEAARPGAGAIEGRGPRPFLKVAGVAGDTAQAVAEAELAASLGYHAVLLSPPRLGWGLAAGVTQAELVALSLERARAVGEVMPVIGFALQTAIGGPVYPVEFWRAFAALESVVAIKAAPFDRYRTLDLVRGVAESGRAAQVSLYTGNDDAIVTDLLTPYTFLVDGEPVTLRFRGGLLGHWCVWTHEAVALFERAKAAAAGDLTALARLVDSATAVTDANAALFDPAHDFAGCIAGVHEVLRRQGLLRGIWCLDPDETLSPGQSEEIDRVIATHPWLTDDAFVAAHLDEWLA